MTATDRSEKIAVFLDRDGTINVEKDYLYRVDDFEFIPGAAEAIRRLNQAGLLTIVVSNQSGVARGYFTLAQVEELHRHIQLELKKHGAWIDAFYICPHHPTEGAGDFTRECSCRKGEPGMLLQAADDLDINLSASYMVGDKIADIEAGHNAGCRSLLVRTGYGEQNVHKLQEGSVTVFPSLTEAADFILAEQQKRVRHSS